jgi:hypothetical protein
MPRLFTGIGILLCAATAVGHHSVIGIYDDQKRFTLEAVVRTYELINPHPLIFVEIIAIPDGQVVDGISVGQTWTLEMDNVRELIELGFNDETFISGDQIVVAVDPSRHTRYRENTLYIRAVEHQRQGFVYLHNVRELFPIDNEGDNLATYLDRIVN